MRDPEIAQKAREYIQAQDMAAYNRLSPRMKKLATRLGALGYKVRRRIGMFGHNSVRRVERVLGVALEKTLWLADKVLFGPYRFIINKAEQAGQAVVNGLKWTVKRVIGAGNWVLNGVDNALGFSETFLKNKNGDNTLIKKIEAMRTSIVNGRRRLRITSYRARKVIDRSWHQVKTGTKNAIKAAAHGCEWAASTLIYTPFAWVFNPRWPNGKPLLMNEMLNKTLGFGLAGLTFAVTLQALAVLKVYALGWHATINTALWNPEAAYLTNLAIIGAGHAAISSSLAIGKMVLLPLIAAARTGLKNYDLTAGIAAQYTERLEMSCRLDDIQEKRILVKEKQPLKMLEHFFVDLVVKGTHPCQFIRTKFLEVAHGTPASANDLVAQQPKATPKGPRP